MRKPLLKHGLFFITLASLILSCSIIKRKYQDGYYIAWKSKTESVQASSRRDPVPASNPVKISETSPMVASAATNWLKRMGEKLIPDYVQREKQLASTHARMKKLLGRPPAHARNAAIAPLSSSSGNVTGWVIVLALGIVLITVGVILMLSAAATIAGNSSTNASASTATSDVSAGCMAIFVIVLGGILFLVGLIGTLVNLN